MYVESCTPMFKVKGENALKNELFELCLYQQKTSTVVEKPSLCQRRQAAFRRLTSAVIIRNVDSEVQKVSAVSSSEWIRESRGIQLVGPSVSWCNRWAAQTKSCSIRNNQCRCGSQSEFDAWWCQSEFLM